MAYSIGPVTYDWLDFVYSFNLYLNIMKNCLVARWKYSGRHIILLNLDSIIRPTPVQPISCGFLRQLLLPTKILF
jgi:hypothetical protein